MDKSSTGTAPQNMVPATSYITGNTENKYSDEKIKTKQILGSKREFIILLIFISVKLCD